MPKAPISRRTSPEKMLEILDLFQEEPRRWSPEQMMSRLGCPRSTLYRYLRVLGNAGLVSALPDIGYTLGPRIAELDYEMRSSDPLITNGRALVQALVAEVPGIGLICRYYKDRVLCIYQESSARELRTSYERGRAMPLARGAASRIILAHLKTAHQQLWYERERTAFARVGMGRTLDAVLAHLREIRKAGYCVTRGELTEGVIGVAAPVHDSEGTILGSLSVTIAESGAGERRLRGVIDRVCFSAKVLTRSMGRIDTT